MTAKLKALSLVLSLSTALLSLAGCMTTGPNLQKTAPGVITDQQLIQLAQQPVVWDDNTKARQEIGEHHGHTVVIETQCSDLCPQNASQIIHYDVPEQATCERIGGVSKSILVPIAITVMPKKYCFPKVIAQYWESAE